MMDRGVNLTMSVSDKKPPVSNGWSYGGTYGLKNNTSLRQTP